MRLFSVLAALVAGCATSGGLPDWVRNPYADFSKDKYVVAVGSGHNLDAAKRDALNGIAAFLGVEITATQGTEESETVTSDDGRRRSTGHLRAAESINQIISQKLSSVVIERAHSQGPTTYILATLDKATFLASLSADADNAARQLGEGVKAAAAEGAPSRSMLLGLQATAQRLQALDARILALGGRVSPDVQVTLRDSLGFLARFDIVVPPPAAPAATAAGPACDENDPRLKKAIADMTALVGHAVGVAFNLDAFPKGRAFCDDLFERFIGLLPKDLERLKTRNAAIFAYGAPALKRIELDYDGTTDRSDVDFDRASGRLRIVMGGRGGYPIPSDAASYVFEKQYEAWVVGHFQGVEPAAVAAAEYPLYFDYLTRLSWWGRGAPRHASDEATKDVANDPKATVVLQMIAFAPLAARRDAALGGKVRDWLADRYELFGMAYLHKPGPSADAPAGSPWKRAERAWVDWMNASFEGLSDDKKKTALVEMLGFTMPFNNDEGIVWNEFAYPGLKTYEMGLGIIDRWLKAGHPSQNVRRGDDKQLQLFVAIASPVKRDNQNSWSVETIDRRKNWYFHATRTDEQKKRLLAEVLARKDDVFTETVFANLLYTSIHLHGSYAKEKRDEWGDFLFFWRGVEADQRQWKIATRVLAEGELADAMKRAVYDESARLWRRYPWARGTLLYYLGIGIRYPRDLVPWKDFAHVFGAPLGQKEVADFLTVSPRSVSALPSMWPALGRGWSRAELLVPHLDRFVEDPLTRAWNFQDPYETFKDIVNDLRDEKASADLARLHVYFKKRVADHPSEARAYETLIDMTR